jgi:hypothetical protein
MSGILCHYTGYVIALCASAGCCARRCILLATVGLWAMQHCVEQFCGMVRCRHSSRLARILVRKCLWGRLTAGSAWGRGLRQSPRMRARQRPPIPYQPQPFPRLVSVLDLPPFNPPRRCFGAVDWRCGRLFTARTAAKPPRPRVQKVMLRQTGYRARS